MDAATFVKMPTQLGKEAYKLTTLVGRAALFVNSKDVIKVSDIISYQDLERLITTNKKLIKITVKDK